MMGCKRTRLSSVTTATCVPCSWNTNAVEGIVKTCLSTGAVRWTWALSAWSMQRVPALRAISHQGTVCQRVGKKK